MNKIDFFDLCHHLVDICGKSLLSLKQLVKKTNKQTNKQTTKKTQTNKYGSNWRDTPGPPPVSATEAGTGCNLPGAKILSIFMKSRFSSRLRVYFDCDSFRLFIQPVEFVS